jgi:phospholipid/cholesterol/gamma-HCH transport system permease protein
MIISFIGQCVINLYLAIRFLFSGHVSLKNIIFQASKIGYDSMPIALVISLVSGAVFALQVSKQFIQSGADAYIGGLISVAIVREMAPVFASLAVAARAGTGITAEIANMQVTEQIDALKTLKVDPIEYLLLPRLIAGITMVPLITILSILIGIFGGMLIAKLSINLHHNLYYTSVLHSLRPYDVYVSLIKAATFGGLIALICSTHGLLTSGGAKEVGRSTTKAAVYTSIAILLFDFFITWISYC